MKTAKIVYGATDLGVPQFSGDILWRTGFRAPDPVFLIETGKDAVLFASTLEAGRARKEAGVGEVIQTNNALRDAKRLLKYRRINEVRIPSEFPYRIGKALEEEFRVVTADPPFYPARMRKTRKEIAEISKAQRAAERALKRAVRFLRVCRIKGKLIYEGGRTVSAETVRKIIDDSLWQEGYLATGTIVASGVQAADPHATGSGPLRAYAPIVIDIFPVSLRTHYYADMTRTIFKGEPAREYIRMYETVRQAQERAIAKIRAGADGKEIYNDVCRYLREEGYPTRIDGGMAEGFIHGLGHGVGIEIHEPPNLGTGNWMLEPGNVVTVEPGLYYPRPHKGIPAGGIRIEDMAIVKKGGRDTLTRFPKDLAHAVIP